MSLPYCEYFYINVLSTYKSGYKLKQKKKKKLSQPQPRKNLEMKRKVKESHKLRISTIKVAVN